MGTDLIEFIVGLVRAQVAALSTTDVALAKVRALAGMFGLRDGVTNLPALPLHDVVERGLPALVEPPHDDEPVKITPAGGGTVLWNGEHGGSAVLVAGTAPPDVVELWDWTLGPGDRCDSDAHAAGTRELMQVLHGTVSVDVGGHVVTLAEGAAAAFAGDVPHSYSGADGTGTRFSLAVFEPGVGPTTTTKGKADA